MDAALAQLQRTRAPKAEPLHLIVHLATEVRLAGPVHFRNMWSVERYIGKLKGMVHTRSHPEGSIAEGYTLDASLTYCAPESLQVDDLNPISSSDQLPYLRIIGRPLSACACFELDYISWTQAQRCVLVNYPEIKHYAKCTKLNAQRIDA